MLFNKSIKNKVAFLLAGVVSATAVFSQSDLPVANPAPASGYNLLAVLLVIMTIVLAFVIWGMGQILTALGRQILDKNKNASKVLTVLILAGFLLASNGAWAQDPAKETISKPLPNYGGLSANTYYGFLIVIGVEIILILFLAFSIRRLYTELLPEKVRSKNRKPKFAAWWKKMDSKLFTRAVAVEKEADILLDHDYDGIRELDNSLPPWWKYGFYITIAVAFIYLLNYHVLGIGLNPEQEYHAEMEKAKVEKEIYEAKNKDKVDEENVLMADADGLKAGQRLFESNCAACHLKDGGGNVGPNLTDDYWLHKGSLTDIYHSIKNGYPDKGMQSWSSTFSPKEISYLASYIKSLKGSKPATPKEQQGEFYKDITVGDSAVIAKPDSAIGKK